MSERVAAQSAGAKDIQPVYKNPKLGWMIGFLFIVGFRGLFTVVPLRKIMILDLKLTYPNGIATAHVINSFNSPKGDKLANVCGKQLRELGKFFSFSFLWGFFQWFFTGGDDCGFDSFPTFGLKPYEQKFYFDFSATYVGIGMICPHIINVSLLIGGILSWGIMWPLIATKKGDWYSADLKPNSIQGIQGYKLFIFIAMILGDGLYNFFKVLSQTLVGLVPKFQARNKDNALSVAECPHPPVSQSLLFDDNRRTQFFLKDQIPTWFAVGGYVLITAISSAALPHIFPQLKWYHILVIYFSTPILAICNAFGCGLTDFSMAPTYGKLAIFMIGQWAGASNGGVLAEFQDRTLDIGFTTVHVREPSDWHCNGVRNFPLCLLDLLHGLPGSQYPAPLAHIYHNMAKLSVVGFSTLPKNCLLLCFVFFGAAIVINLMRDSLGKNRAWLIPLPMVMALPFYIGPHFAIDMCVGSLILNAWGRISKAEADAFGCVVASGLICGDGAWTLPSSMLAMAGVKPPICMKFLPTGTNKKVDEFLGS
ncbi:unnamed protein product [Ilex paraguariensis]|uniref:Uncharacterized protein n=1 Tax=Ilex paraguariensis TaxID=185542 RepID=A0ABC8UWW5_9AQUA